jgi:hypothetical protein
MRFKKFSLWGGYGVGGDILDGTGSTGTILGSDQSDIMTYSDSADLVINALGGDDIVSLSNVSGSLKTCAGGDIVDAFHFIGVMNTGSDGDSVTLNGGSIRLKTCGGDDMIFSTNATGRLNGGAGADIFMIWHDGVSDLTIDLGKDQDSDILIVDGSSAGVTLLNYDPETDVVIWDRGDNIA